MIQDLHGVIQLIEGDWATTHVLVVGDVMLDRYIWGDVERISPEAPVPIVRSAHRNERPGGAANVAMNIVGLGAKATLVGFCGDDADGIVLRDSLLESGVNPSLAAVGTHPTTSKLRIVSGRQQMLRLDTERTGGYTDEEFERLNEKIVEAIGSANCVVLSDYAKGVLSDKICQTVIQASRRKGIPVVVDPKHKDLSRYRGATTICPNASELSLATGVSQRELGALLEAGQRLVPGLEIEYLTATLSEQGIAVLREESKLVIP